MKTAPRAHPVLGRGVLRHERVDDHGHQLPHDVAVVAVDRHAVAVDLHEDVVAVAALRLRLIAAARRHHVAPRVDEHRAIVDALAAHDSKGARAAMRAHLSRVVDDLLEATRLELIQRAEADVDARRVLVVRRAWA